MTKGYTTIERERIRRRAAETVARNISKVVSIAGPPAAGKTTYAMDQMQATDMIVDVDRLTRALTGRDAHDRSKSVASFVFAARATIMKRILENNGSDDVGIIYVTSLMPEAAQREEFVQKYGGRSLLIMPTKEECLRRLSGDGDRSEPVKNEIVAAIDKWFAAYTPSAIDEIIDTSETADAY